MKSITLILALLLGVVSLAQAEPLNLTYSHIVVDRNTAIYNPTNEFIFSSIIKTDHISNPLGKYYLYYAPHNAPGGISLAYSDNIQGPFKEYSANPLVSNTHQGRFSVSHVSSPNIIWAPQHNKYIMYFHGENTTTRWAYSTDGINWDVPQDNVAISTSMWGANFTECSYARVFEYSIPDVGNRYVMVMMLIKSGFGRRIGLAISNDGKKFTPYNEALISQGPGEGTDISGAFYWPHDGKHYILYHGTTGKIYYTEVGPRFDQEIHRGVFYSPETSYPENGKASAPFLIWENNRWNMFYDVGIRLDQTIGYAYELPYGEKITIDNTDSKFTSGGSWEASKSREGYYGSNYLQDNSSGANSGNWAKWKPTFPRSGYYKVMVRWPAYINRPDNIKYNIYSQGKVTEVRENQQLNNGSWVYLGRYYFDAGTSENNRLTLDAGSDSGYVIADAAQFIFDGN